MAYELDVLRIFEGLEGFDVKKDVRGQIVDITLSGEYELLSKESQFGLIQKIEFKNPKGETFLFKRFPKH